MKRLVFAPAALARLDEILDYTLTRFGAEQAERYTGQLAARLDALAADTGPRARPCALLMKGLRDVPGLSYCQVGSHFLILRETPVSLELVEVFHARMDLDRQLQVLVDQNSDQASN